MSSTVVFLSPASSETLDVIVDLVLIWKAHDLNIIGKINRLREDEESVIIVKVSFLVTRMRDNDIYFTILVRQGFICGLSVPFTSTDRKLR